jgi:hypothetical protein
MGGAVGKVSDQYGALVVQRDTWGRFSLTNVVVVVVWRAFWAERSGFAIASGLLK